MRCTILSVLFCLLFLTSLTSAQDDSQDKQVAGWPFRWVTSLASAGDKVFAGSANGLLLRESNVVHFPAGDPSKSKGLYTHPVSVWKVVVTPDGAKVASSDYKGNLAIHSLADGKTNMQEAIFERWTRALVMSNDGKHLIAGNEAGKVFLYSLDKNEIAKAQELGGQQIYDIALSADGNTIAACDGAGHVHLMKFPELEVIKKAKCGEAPIWSVAFAADGKSVFAGGADRKLRHLKVASEDDAKELGKATDWITAIERDASGDLAIGAMNGSMYTYSSTGFENVGETPSGIWSVSFVGDNLLAATRKNMVATFVRSWKLGHVEPSEGE